MKELGMNLKEIKELLDKEDLNLIEAILIKKKAAIDQEIAERVRQREQSIPLSVIANHQHRAHSQLNLSMKDQSIKPMSPRTFMIMVLMPMK